MKEDGSKPQDLFVDVWYGYNIPTHEDGSEPARKIQKDLTPKIRKHLLDAINKGGLRCLSKVNTYLDFHRLWRSVGCFTRPYFYGNLVNWRINSGYEDSRLLAVGPALEEYEGRK